MARPIKQGLDYFTVDTDWDRKMKLFQAKFKSEGTGIIIALWQWIYKEGYFIRWDDETKVMFASENYIEEKKLNEMMAFAIEKGIFDKRLYEKYQILTSKGIQKRYLNSCIRRIEIHFNKDFLLIEPETPDWSNTKIIIDENTFVSDNSNSEKSTIEENESISDSEIKNKEEEFISEYRNPKKEYKTRVKESETSIKNSRSTQRKGKERKGKESKFIDDLKVVEKIYFSLFEEEFENKPDYKYPRDRKIIKDYLKNYPVEQICELITIWIVLRIGEWNGYSIPCLQKDFNKLIVVWQKTGMNHFTREEYEKYSQNVQKVNQEYKKNIEVPPYEEWRKENFRIRFEEVNIPSQS